MVGFNLCGAAEQQRAAGTTRAPIVVPWLPMVDRNTTVGGASEFDRYGCAPDTNERGPERVYQFTVNVGGTFVARVRDGQGVDVDLHLLSALNRNQRVAESCLGRAHEDLIVENIEPGIYWLVVDSWTNRDGTNLPGAYTLTFDVIPTNAWRSVTVAPGVQWHRYFGPVDGGDQRINVVQISPARSRNLVVRDHGGCRTVPSVAGDDMLVGINGGYFGLGCTAIGDLIVDDTVVSRSAPTSPALPMRPWVYWSDDGLMFSWRDADAARPNERFGMSSHPMLVENGRGLAAVQPNEQVYSAIDWGRNPRTVIAKNVDGDSLLITVDGRTPGGAGLSTPALAQWLANELSVTHALNLDGGGSSTLFIRDCSLDGVVNFPSDNRQADSFGARRVGNGIYLR